MASGRMKMLAAVGCASDDASLWSPEDEAELRRITNGGTLLSGEPSGAYVNLKKNPI